MLPHPHPRRRRGAALIEYGLLAGLVALTSIGAVSSLGWTIRSAVSSSEERLADAVGGGEEANGGALPDAGGGGQNGGGGQGGGGPLPPAPDTTPDAFVLPPTFGMPGQPTPSMPLTITGIDAPTPFAVTGHPSAVAFLNGGVSPLGSGTVTNGGTLMLEAQAPLAEGASLPVSLTVGGVEAIWTLTAHDLTPEPFAFAPQAAPPGTPLASESVSLAGIDGPSPYTLQGAPGFTLLANGAPVPATGTFLVGTSLSLQGTTPATPGDAVDAVLTVGGVEAIWTLTAQDLEPDAFAFAPTTVAPAATATSNPIAIAGIDAPTPFAVTGDASAVAFLNGGTTPLTSGTVVAGDTLVLQANAPAAESTTLPIALTVGTVAGVWAVTSHDLTPDAFAFAPSTEQMPGALVESSPIALAGTSAPTAIAVAGDGNPEFSLNGGPWTNGPATAAPGDTVTVRLTAPATTAATHTATLTVGGVAATFQASTVASIVVTAASAPSYDVGTAFGAHWAADVAKTLVVPAGVTLGPTTIPAGMGGTLTLQNAGEIQGLGGAANGGAGGDAITASSSFTLANTGAVRAGGGGGGQGGAGGAGSTSGWVSDGIRSGQPNVTTPGNNGWYYSRVNSTSPYQRLTIRWDNIVVVDQTPVANVTTLTTWNRTPTERYFRHTLRTLFAAGTIYYDVERQRLVSTPTAGGAGGTGGQGQGYGQAAQTGGAGAAGAGGGAGTGGTGGSGGNWGSAGTAGGTGAAGTGGAGATGLAAGAPGRAVRMLSGTLAVTTVGTINGVY